MFKVCIAVPAQIVEIEGDSGIVQFSALRKDVNLSLIENPSIGDYVLIHAGFAIEKLNKAEADLRLAIFEEYING